ncbi:CCA tRNA nucleotidyltransferase [Spirulina sp. CS-785/01]|uniref:CCA tRNA nucleotidyltransferase n=1 Tax=Spirulina sp. CS-785/01 TaxID=3021716 RepID=UPI00232D0787|nr:CCA tRNA nucleotidyltransferase [Spirulina sp. CS-785/01]MDB9312350.1 CCA tRNA nucleotidyltransferase [Spirulina sp. CS-785/01]
MQYVATRLLKKLPFPLDWLPKPAYIVGGAVRDALLEREKDQFDLDFVLPENAVATAQNIAQQTQAGFVVLDEQRQIARVVFDQGTADFAQQEGDTLEDDLKRRDFRINAIAYNPHTQDIIDPLKGLKDLERRELRMIDKSNFNDDPLRILRGYRQAAQLGLTIKPKTRNTLRKLAPKLAQVAAERVQQELQYLLVSPETPWLYAAWEDRVLQVWLGKLPAENVQQIEQIEHSAWLLSNIWTELGQQLRQPIGNTSTLLSLTKLASLVSPNPQTAQTQLETLKYSRVEVRTVTTLLEHLPRLLEITDHPLTPEEQYFLFQKVGDHFPALAVLTVAVAAHQDTLRETKMVGFIAPLVNTYLNPKSQISHPTPLLTGSDLIQDLALKPSPKIGKLLTQVQLAYITGKVSSREEALEYARRQVRLMGNS